MEGMFYLCSSLESLNLSSFNTENVINMYTMFSYCYSLKSLDISNLTLKMLNLWVICFAIAVI